MGGIGGAGSNGGKFESSGKFSGRKEKKGSSPTSPTGWFWWTLFWWPGRSWLGFRFPMGPLPVLSVLLGVWTALVRTDPRWLGPVTGAITLVELEVLMLDRKVDRSNNAADCSS